MTTVGTGTYTYTVIEDWAKLPPGENFAMVSAVATDSQDRVYAFQRKDPPVLVFDRDGNFLNSWGNGAFLFAHGISITDDTVYLTDRDSSVCIIYTLDGKPIQMLGRHGVHSDTGCEQPAALVPQAAGPFNYPSELVVAPSGDLYVSDGYRNARVHKFSADGKLILSWGEPGIDPGQFIRPHNIAIDADDRVYVVDREAHRIQIFDEHYEFVDEWPQFGRPNDVFIDSDDTMYVLDSESGDERNPGMKRGLYIGSAVGGTLQAYIPPHETEGPHGTIGEGVTLDAAGNIFVGEVSVRGMTMFTRR